MAKTKGLVVEELDGGLVIYDGHDALAHYLDPSATAVWRICHQPSTEPEILGATSLDATSGETVLSKLIDLGLVKAESGSGYSRRAMLQTAAKVGLGGAMLTPVISAIVPVAAASASARPTVKPLTPGYWKNHESATTPLLPQPLGDYIVKTFTVAKAVFDQMNFGGTDAFAGLAGHLLAAELNVANGVGTPCANQAISEANALLSSANYKGPYQTYSPTAAQRNEAITLATLLNNYNNGSLTCS